VYHPGELVVKGYNKGAEVAQYALNTTGKATAITINMYKDPLITSRTRVQQIEVSLTDDKGQLVYDADNPVTVNITGTATLLGIENSDANDTGDYRSNTRKARNGRLIVYVQLPEKLEGYSIKLESPGLQPAIFGSIMQ
jgi:hypothetical protein